MVFAVAPSQTKTSEGVQLKDLILTLPALLPMLLRADALASEVSVRVMAQTVQVPEAKPLEPQLASMQMSEGKAVALGLALVFGGLLWKKVSDDWEAEKSLEKVQATNNKSLGNVTDLESKVEGLESELDSTRVDLGKIFVDLTMSEERLQETQARLKSYQAQSVSNQAEEAKLTGSRSTLEDLQREVERASVAVSTLERQREDDSRRHQAILADKDYKLERQLEDLTTLRSSLQQESAQTSELKAKLDASNKQLSELQALLGAAERRRVGGGGGPSREEISAAQASIRQLQAEQAKQSAAAEQASQQLQTHSNVLQSLVLDLLRAVGREDEAEEYVSVSLEEGIRVALDEAEGLRDAKIELETKLKREQYSSNNLQKELKLVSRAKEDLRGQLAVSSRAQGQLETQLATSERYLRESEERYEALKEQMQQMQGTVAYTDRSMQGRMEEMEQLEAGTDVDALIASKTKKAVDIAYRNWQSGMNDVLRAKEAAEEELLKAQQQVQLLRRNLAAAQERERNMAYDQMSSGSAAPPPPPPVAVPAAPASFSAAEEAAISPQLAEVQQSWEAFVEMMTSRDRTDSAQWPMAPRGMAVAGRGRSDSPLTRAFGSFIESQLRLQEQLREWDNAQRLYQAQLVQDRDVERTRTAKAERVANELRERQAKDQERVDSLQQELRSSKLSNDSLRADLRDQEYKYSQLLKQLDNVQGTVQYAESSVTRRMEEDRREAAATPDTEADLSTKFSRKARDNAYINLQSVLKEVQASKERVEEELHKSQVMVQNLRRDSNTQRSKTYEVLAAETRVESQLEQMQKSWEKFLDGMSSPTRSPGWAQEALALAPTQPIGASGQSASGLADAMDGFVAVQVKVQQRLAQWESAQKNYGDTTAEKRAAELESKNKRLEAQQLQDRMQLDQLSQDLRKSQLSVDNLRADLRDADWKYRSLQQKLEEVTGSVSVVESSVQQRMVEETRVEARVEEAAEPDAASKFSKKQLDNAYRQWQLVLKEVQASKEKVEEELHKSQVQVQQMRRDANTARSKNQAVLEAEDKVEQQLEQMKESWAVFVDGMTNPRRVQDNTDWADAALALAPQASYGGDAPSTLAAAMNEFVAQQSKLQQQLRTWESAKRDYQGVSTVRRADVLHQQTAADQERVQRLTQELRESQLMVDSLRASLRDSEASARNGQAPSPLGAAGDGRAAAAAQNRIQQMQRQQAADQERLERLTQELRQSQLQVDSLRANLRDVEAVQRGVAAAPAASPQQSDANQRRVEQLERQRQSDSERVERLTQELRESQLKIDSLRASLRDTEAAARGGMPVAAPAAAAAPAGQAAALNKSRVEQMQRQQQADQERMDQLSQNLRQSQLTADGLRADLRDADARYRSLQQQMERVGGSVQVAESRVQSVSSAVRAEEARQSEEAEMDTATLISKRAAANAQRQWQMMLKEVQAAKEKVEEELHRSQVQVQQLRREANTARSEALRAGAENTGAPAPAYTPPAPQPTPAYSAPTPAYSAPTPVDPQLEQQLEQVMKSWEVFVNGLTNPGRNPNEDFAAAAAKIAPVPAYQQGDSMLTRAVNKFLGMQVQLQQQLKEWEKAQRRYQEALVHRRMEKLQGELRDMEFERQQEQRQLAEVTKELRNAHATNHSMADTLREYEQRYGALQTKLNQVHNNMAAVENGLQRRMQERREQRVEAPAVEDDGEDLPAAVVAEKARQKSMDLAYKRWQAVLEEVKAAKVAAEEELKKAQVQVQQMRRENAARAAEARANATDMPQGVAAGLEDEQRISEQLVKMSESWEAFVTGLTNPAQAGRDWASNAARLAPTASAGRSSGPLARAMDNFVATQLKLQNMLREWESLSGDESKLASENQELRYTMQFLKEEVVAKTQEAEASQGMARQMKETLEKTLGAKDELTRHLTNLQDQQEKDQDRMMELSRELRSLQDNAYTLKTRLSEAESGLRESEERYSALQTHLQKVQGNLHDTERGMQERFEEAGGAEEMTKKALDDAYRKWEVVLVEAKRAKEKAEEELHASQLQVQQLRKDLNKAKADAREAAAGAPIGGGAVGGGSDMDEEFLEQQLVEAQSSWEAFIDGLTDPSRPPDTRWEVPPHQSLGITGSPLASALDSFLAAQGELQNKLQDWEAQLRAQYKAAPGGEASQDLMDKLLLTQQSEKYLEARVAGLESDNSKLREVEEELREQLARASGESYSGSSSSQSPSGSDMRASHVAKLRARVELLEDELRILREVSGDDAAAAAKVEELVQDLHRAKAALASEQRRNEILQNEVSEVNSNCMSY